MDGNGNYECGADSDPDPVTFHSYSSQGIKQGLGGKNFEQYIEVITEQI